MEVVIGLIAGIVIGALISGVLIWLVSKLNLGLKVDNFGWAMLAGLIIGILTNVVMQFFKDIGGLGGALIHLVVAAVVIYASGQILKGLTVKGFAGALLAAVAIALINLGLLWLSGAVTTA